MLNHSEREVDKRCKKYWKRKELQKIDHEHSATNNKPEPSCCRLTQEDTVGRLMIFLGKCENGKVENDLVQKNKLFK